MNKEKDTKLTVIGSVHIDVFADTSFRVEDGLDLPGQFVLSVGGTAFNVCSALKALGASCFFISALKKGSLFTRLILQRLQQLGLSHHIVLKSDLPDSAFLALRVQGELLFAVTATCVDLVDEEIKEVVRENSTAAAVVDCNLSECCLNYIAQIYPRVYVCATSQVKAKKLLSITYKESVKAVFLNQAEAFQLVNLFSMHLNDIIPTHWFVTRGADGVTVVTPQGQHVDIPNPEFKNIESTSGAGDAFAAGVIYALEHLGLTPVQATEKGFEQVEKALASKFASVPYVDLARVDAALFTDKLTGVYTRTLFEERKHMFKTGCVMLIDIDHFKKVNDTYGHQYGDQVLQKVARVVKSCIRASDEVYRYGGEEFVVILKGPLRAAVDICNRIQKEVQSKTSVTVTIGCASINGDINVALKQADELLYHGKKAGRNRVVISETALLCPL